MGSWIQLSLCRRGGYRVAAHAAIEEPAVEDLLWVEMGDLSAVD